MSRMGALILCLGLSAAAMAQPKPEELIKLTVKPAAPPTPSLRYKLLPELRDLTPGNAAQLYYRAYSPEWQFYRQKDQQKALDDWSRDITKMPPDDLKWVTTTKMLMEVDRAARREYCNFEVIPRAREEGIGLLLPDLQGFREIAKLLAARARFEMAAGEFDKATDTFKTGFALSRHVSEGGTLIHALVGMAMVQTMCATLEQGLTLEGAPNFYHALTYLPRPLINMRNGYEGERLFQDWIFPGLREQLTPGKLVPMSDSEVKAIRDRLAGIIKSFQMEPEVAKLADLLKDIEKVHADAKKTLVSLGHKEATVDKLPATQAVLLLELYNCDRLYDEMLRAVQLPYPEALEPIAELEKESKKDSLGHAMARMLLPAMHKVLGAQTRVERRIAALRIIEAIRLHAAANKGELPASLDAIKVVKVPLDPSTGKAFGYKVDDKTFTLSSPPLTDQKLTYIVTVK